MNLIGDLYDMGESLKALNALDMNGAKKIPFQFSEISVKSLDILSGGETSQIIELNRLISKVQRALKIVQNKIPSSTPSILMQQNKLLLVQILLVNAELSSPKYDYLWAAFKAYNKIHAAFN